MKPFFLGIFIGFAIALLIGTILYYFEPDRLDKPKKFGDMEIFLHKISDYEHTIISDSGTSALLLVI